MLSFLCLKTLFRYLEVPELRYKNTSVILTSYLYFMKVRKKEKRKNIF